MTKIIIGTYKKDDPDKENGYQNTIKYLKELYSKDKISMTHKSKIINELNGWEVLPKRLRKWAIKI